MAEKHNLPPFFLWMSVVISAISLGVMISEARTLPLFVALMLFTIFYHSALLVSSLVNSRSNASSGGRCLFYMDPLEGVHMGWALGFVIFWLCVFMLRFTAVVKGVAEEDRDIVLATLSGVELVLNIKLACWTIVKWRSEGLLRQRSHQHEYCDNVEDLESGQMDDSIDEEDVIAIVEYLAEHMQRAGLTHCQHQCQHPHPPQYITETPPKLDTPDLDKEKMIP